MLNTFLLKDSITKQVQLGEAPTFFAPSAVPSFLTMESEQVAGLGSVCLKGHISQFPSSLGVAILLTAGHRDKLDYIGTDLLFFTSCCLDL